MTEAQRVIYVEDDAEVRSSVAQTLELAGWQVNAFARAEAALPLIATELRGVVVTDVQLPQSSGLELMACVHAIDADIPVILVTAHGDVDMAVAAMRDGAYDFIEKPFPPERLINVVQRAQEKRALRLTVNDLRQQLERRTGIEAVLMGRSAAVRKLREQIQALAQAPVDVVVHGETGTGKEMVARCLHEFGPRRNAQLVAINCGGLPESLLESELFGYEAGAFTTANKRRIGKIEHADGGTLFLDEIESMPMSFQVRLLRVLQERTIERLGSNSLHPVDIRVVAATKFDLLALSKQQKFRSDLYYRLNVAELHLPPLRERGEDIPILFEHFTLQASARFQRSAPTLESQRLHQLMAHDWPGNVRELKNVADRFVLGLLQQQAPIVSPAETPSLTLAQQLDQIEKALIEQALKQHGGRPQPVIDMLGIGRKTLYDKVHKHGIRLHEFRGAAGAAAEHGSDVDE